MAMALALSVSRIKLQRNFMSTPKKRIWFVTNGTAKYFYSAPNVRDAETKGREYAVTTGWNKAQLWECTNKEICRNEDLPLVEKKALTRKHTLARTMVSDRVQSQQRKELYKGAV
jgi:hypothetical protein